MAAPNSKATLKEYIKRALGAPVLEINVDDDQFDDRIDQALQYFHQYHYDGSIKMYLKHQITDSKITNMKSDESFTESAAGTHAYTDEQFKQQQNYIVLPDFVMAVMNIFPFNDKHNLNMFDLRYQLRLNDLYDLTATNVLYYEMVQQHIRLLDNILVGRQPVRFNQHQNRLYLDMDVDMINSNEFLIIECYRKLDPNDFTDIYNDMWLKKYATALLKRQWGQNLLKFQGVKLPGGIELNGRQIYDDAEKELDKIREVMSSTYELPPLDFIG